MQKKIGYCTNDSYTEDGKPCPKAETKENQLLLNPFTLRCEICDQDLKIEILKEPTSIKIKKKIVFLSKILVGVLLTSILIFSIVKGIEYLFGEKDTIIKKDDLKVDDSFSNQESHNPKKIDETNGMEKESDQPSLPPNPPGEKIKGTLKFPDGDKYIGEIKDGLMDGTGVYVFAKRQLISDKDIRNRYAEAGDTLKGVWKKGNFIHGNLLYKNVRDGKRGETIIIGQ